MPALSQAVLESHKGLLLAPPQTARSKAWTTKVKSKEDPRDLKDLKDPKDLKDLV